MEKIMNNELELSGLKLVYGGLILQLISFVFIGGLASALMKGTAGSGIICFVINAAAVCVILAGLARLGPASPFFARAKKPFLIQLLMQAVLILIFMILGVREWTVGNIAYTDRSSVIEMLIGALVILIISILTRLVSVRALLRGCGHVAEQVNDPLFSIRCMKSWRLWYMAYLLLILAALAGVAVIVTVVRKTIENGTSEEEMTQAIFTNVSSSVLLVSIVTLAVLVFFVIAHILFIGKMRVTYREYHLKEVREIPVSGQRPAFADYLQRELEGVQEDGESGWQEETEKPDEEEDLVSEAEDTGADEEIVSEAADVEEKLIAGRRYRRIEEESEEEETDPGDLLEIAKLFKKK